MSFALKSLGKADLEAHGVSLSLHFVGKTYTKVFEIPAGKRLDEHVHAIDHDSHLIAGTAKLHRGSRIIEMRAPAIVRMPAHRPHAIEAVTDVLWACVWPNPEQLLDAEALDAKVIA